MRLKERIRSFFGASLAQKSTKVSFGSKQLQQEMPEIARRAAAEGIVLLKNDDHVLPLNPDKKISVFGRVQNDYFCVGYGSGGDVKPPYITSMMQALCANKNISLNENLAAIYRQWCSKNPAGHGAWGHWPRYYDEMPLTRQIVAEAAKESEIALVLIGRAAGEDRDNALEKGSYYLTDEEMDMLDQVTAAFIKTIVVFNCGNIIDLSWLRQYEDKISAVLYAWQGGMEGANALADVLSGDVSPSGKLTDTIAERYDDYPSAGHFGKKSFNNYVEDIYVGYRYFETFAKDAVLYPFGYGLSYTDFCIETNSCLVENSTVRVDVTVTNTGNHYKGKETVQVYYSAPQGALGKPLRELAAFAKTRLLEPGQSQSLYLTFGIHTMASYDDAGTTGYKSAYVLEPGEYEFFVGNSVRSAARAGSHPVDSLIVVEQLQEVNALPPENRFQRLKPVAGDTGNFIKQYEDTPVRTSDLRTRIEQNLPREIAQTGNRGIKLWEVKAGKATLDAFAAQLSMEELDALCRGYGCMNSPLGTPGNAGVFGGITQSLRDKGIAPVTTTDGPSGIRLSTYTSLLPCGTALAATWNTELLKQLSETLGREMILKGTDVLLSPGMNIHRNPLCGRNFEYYSEDPLLTGKIACAVVNGIQSQGVSACPKHLACNNQETERCLNDSRVSERALREIYLRGFEICVRQSAPQNIMTSYNKVNGIWSHYNYDLCTTVLRGEWGYRGNVITDWWMRPARDPDFPALSNNAYRIRAQVDVLMPGGTSVLSHNNDKTLLKSYARPNGITLGEMQRSAKNVLRFVIKSMALYRLQEQTPGHAAGSSDESA